MCDKYVMGIDAGGTKVAYGLFISGGELLDRQQHPTDIEANGPDFCDSVISAINNLLTKNHLELSDLEGIGICMPSLSILKKDGYI